LALSVALLFIEFNLFFILGFLCIPFLNLSFLSWIADGYIKGFFIYCFRFLIVLFCISIAYSFFDNQFESFSEKNSITDFIWLIVYVLIAGFIMIRLPQRLLQGLTGRNWRESSGEMSVTQFVKESFHYPIKAAQIGKGGINTVIDGTKQIYEK